MLFTRLRGIVAPPSFATAISRFLAAVLTSETTRQYSYDLIMFVTEQSMSRTINGLRADTTINETGDKK